MTRSKVWRCPDCRSAAVQLRYLKPDDEGNLPSHNIVFTCSMCHNSWKSVDAEAKLGPSAAMAVEKVKAKQKAMQAAIREKAQ